MKVKFARAQANYTANVKPLRASRAAAAYDVMSTVQVCINPGETKVIPLGFAMEIEGPFDAYAIIHSRSGLAQRGIVVDDPPKIIDPDFRGEVCVPLKNTSQQPFVVGEGQRIAQMIFQQCHEARWNEVEPEHLTPTNRGRGGFGSTGAF